jgi:release factor glutamine methyltransferase
MGVSIATVIKEAAEIFRTLGMVEPRLEAGLLLSHTLGQDRTYLIAHSDREISPQQLDTFYNCLSRRAAGEPLQYIVGHQEFFKHSFEVTPDVLIPRPETELIVEIVLDLFPDNARFSFADMGAGSGCIAISILQERPHAQATAIDKSVRALKVVQRNAIRHQVLDRLRLLQSDLFSELGPGEMFDLIVSNPPYIPDGEMSGLQREVQREPRSALAGGSDGLGVVRRLMRDAPHRLKPDGYLIFEFGINQDGAITDLVNQDLWELIEIRRDLQQIPRTIVLRKK